MDTLTMPAIADDLEMRLEPLAATEPAIPLVWRARDAARGVPVNSVEHLAVLISRLCADEFGILERADGGAWSQTLRAAGTPVMRGSWRWGGTPAVPYARRVIRGSQRWYPDRAHQVGGYELEESESFTSMAAAEVMWAWAHGRVPTGLSLTLKHLTAREAGHAGR